MPLSVYPDLSNPVVLCIDNSQTMLERERAFLESFGCAVLTASNSGQGLALAAVHSVDVVVLADSPAINGQEVAMEVRRLRPQAPIIMLAEAADVPGPTLILVDALVAKNCLDSQLLPAISYLHGRTHLSPSWDT